MNESNEIHRDIYVGMVAEEMAQSGYYGEDVTLYGFLANGELHSFDDEQECAETYLLALAAGAEISRMTSMHKRCQKKRSAKKAAREELASEMRTMLAAEPAPFARRTVDLRALSDYTKGLAKPRGRCAWPRFADPADASRKREASLPAARRFRNIARADHGRGVSRNARCALRVATLI